MKDRFFAIIDCDVLLAVHLEEVIEGAGGMVVAIAPSSERALSIAGSAEVDCAIIDPFLANESALGAALKFIGRGIPVVVTSGGDRGSMPPELRRCAFVSKPWRVERLLETCRAAMASETDRRSVAEEGASGGAFAPVASTTTEPLGVESGPMLEKDD